MTCIRGFSPGRAAVLGVLGSLLTVASPGWAQRAAPVPGLSERPAVLLAGASQAMVLGTARAGERIVGVGDHGVVLLSDDGGGTFHQAKAVPTRATLTAVHFVSDREGWAVGHRGI